MKRFVFAVLALISVSCVPQRPPSLDATTASAAAGRKLFQAHCAECHGVEAMGTDRAPSLRDAASMSDARLYAIITNGDLRAGMPSWSRLPPQRRWQIISFLRSLNASAEVEHLSAAPSRSGALP